jgi:hypothetical protein
MQVWFATLCNPFPGYRMAMQLNTAMFLSTLLPTHMVFHAVSFIVGKCLPNFVSPSQRHASLVCNPLQPFSWLCSSMLLCFFIFLFPHIWCFMVFPFMFVSLYRNFYKFLYLFYIHICVACNPRQPYMRPLYTMRYIAIYTFTFTYVCFSYLVCVCFSFI